MPPHQFALTGGLTEWIGLDMNTLPDAPRKNRTGWPDWKTRLHAGYFVDDNGCHVWQRSRNNRGYGVIYFDGRLHLAHRAAFYEKHGRWPEQGLVTDHVCENKACVNADHLQELTNSENILRAYRHLDAAGEPRRVRNRIAKKKYLSKIRGGQNPVV